MPLARWTSSEWGIRRRTRRSVTAKPGIESLEGRALLSQMSMATVNGAAAIHAAKAVAGVFPPADDAYWQPLRYIDGKVLLPGPSIVTLKNLPRLIGNPLLAKNITPPKGVAYLYYGNNQQDLFELS